MKVQFTHEDYWELDYFRSNLAGFESRALDYGIYITGAMKLVPEDDPGPCDERLTLVLIPCEFEMESIEELYEMVEGFCGIEKSGFVLNSQTDADGTPFFEMKIL